jgi:hypothetical protein
MCAYHRTYHNKVENQIRGYRFFTRAGENNNGLAVSVETVGWSTRRTDSVTKVGLENMEESFVKSFMCT